MSSNSLEENLNSILSKELPDSLLTLAQRPESFTQAIQYLEGSYADAKESGNDKSPIVENAKSIVVKGLLTVMNDIESAANSLSRLVDLQTIAVDSIASNVEFVGNRLNNIKEQRKLNELDEMKIFKGTELTASIIETDESTNSTTTFKRISIQERISQLQAIGIDTEKS